MYRFRGFGSWPVHNVEPATAEYPMVRGPLQLGLGRQFLSRSQSWLPVGDGLPCAHKSRRFRGGKIPPRAMWEPNLKTIFLKLHKPNPPNPQPSLNTKFPKL